MPGGTISPLHQLPAATAAPKRPFDESQHVGPNGANGVSQHRLQPQQQHAVDSPAAVGEPRSRPVFKMKRTGHSGPFPLSGRPVHEPEFSDAQPASTRFPAPLPPGAVKQKPSRPVVWTVKSGMLIRVGELSMPDLNAGPRVTTKVTAPATDQPTATAANGQEDTTMESIPSPALSAPPETMRLPPEVQKVFDAALDDRPYKAWKDENGNLHPTAGTLLPEGYQQSDNPVFPWLCPVRSCRKLLPSLCGLGKHFCNSHRAARFNDNLDGTLTDLGIYANPGHGNGRRFGGFAKPPLIVSKKHMSFAEAPMADIDLHHNALKGTVPQRGGPRRHTMTAKEAPADIVSISSEDESLVSTKQTQQQDPLPTAAMSKLFDMANPDRPYNKWPGPSGELGETYGALLPDGFTLDTTLPDRQWICPVRSCRRLYITIQTLGHHFHRSHRGCRLNDNLDGTLSILGKDNGATEPVVVSRNPLDLEEIVEPTRPTYPYNKKNIAWVKARTTDPSPVPARMETPPDQDSDLSLDFDARDINSVPDVHDVNSDAGISVATDGRPYREWWDESGELVSMAGALIPAGYQLDDRYPSRPWVCPVRSCRMLCKFKRALGFHFMKGHPSDDLNDNLDGTFSVVGSHNRHAPRVVSRKPLDPNEPAMADPRPPPTISKARMEERQARRSGAPSSTPSSNAASTAPAASNTPAAIPGDPARLWSHITSYIDGDVPKPDIPELYLLLNLPKVRDLAPIQPITAADLTDKQIGGLLIQVTGVETPSPCTECRRHNGPFASCVQPSRQVAQDIAGLMRSSLRACANCFLRKNSSCCSIKKLTTNSTGTNNNFTTPRSLAHDDPPDSALADDALFAMRVSMLGRRRSARLTLATESELNGDNDAEDEEEESGDEAPVPEPDYEPLRRARRLVTLKVPKPAQQRQHSRGVEGGGSRVYPPTEEDLHMEDWEMDQGRVHAAGEPLAFSSTYLTANQSVQVSQSVNFQAITIPSGRVHQFAAEQAKTRMCTLASGKLKVRVGGDEFVVGQGGIFKVLPDVACTVTNRCYVNVVLHVTALDGT